MDGVTHLELHHEGDRVRQHTSAKVLDRIDAETLADIGDTIAYGPLAVARRLDELAREWDVDRALMASFAVVGSATFLAGITRYASSPLLGRKRKGLLYLFGVQLGSMLLHATVGWCPPLVVLRRLGFRTAREIEQEKHALEEALAG